MIFKLIEKRYQLDHVALRAARMETGLSQSSFATYCRWSSAYQNKLEGGSVQTLSEQSATIILDVLRKNNVDIPDLE